MNTDLLRKKIRREAKRNDIDKDVLADAVHGVLYLVKELEADAMHYLRGKSVAELSVATDIVLFMREVEKQK